MSAGEDSSSAAGAAPLVAGQPFRTMAELVGLRAISPETAATGLTKAADTIDDLFGACKGLHDWVLNLPPSVELSRFDRREGLAAFNKAATAIAKAVKS